MINISKKCGDLDTFEAVIVSSTVPIAVSVVIGLFHTRIDTMLILVVLASIINSYILSIEKCRVSTFTVSIALCIIFSIIMPFLICIVVINTNIEGTILIEISCYVYAVTLAIANFINLNKQG